MDMLDLIKKTRSYRRFDNSRKLDDSFMSGLIDAARLAQSAANAQPLRYVAVNSADMCGKIYPHLRWAGRLKDWDGPAESERPVAYVCVYADKEAPAVANAVVDSGISMQNMCLYAMNTGVGSCMIGNCIKKEINALLGISERYDLLWVVAFGYPVENVVLTDCDGDVAYYRDKDGNHFVPKYKNEDVLLKKF
ncbi:MAG: nitroreductase family protein [Deferribacterales bacterium]